MSEQVAKTGKAIAVLLIIMMILRINSYFMISENATITRVFKTGLQDACLTGTSILCWSCFGMIPKAQDPSLFTKTFSHSFFYIHVSSSLDLHPSLWSSDQAWSALQIAMDIECVVFVIWYWKAFSDFQ